MNRSVIFLSMVCCAWPLLVHFSISWLGRIRWSEIDWKAIDWSKLNPWRNND